jgi:hypothetical protein
VLIGNLAADPDFFDERQRRVLERVSNAEHAVILAFRDGLGTAR